MTPKQAVRQKDIIKLKRNNISTKNSWFMVDEKTVSIANQRRGETCTGNVTLSRKEFEAFIRFYETGTTRKK